MDGWIFCLFTLWVMCFHTCWCSYLFCGLLSLYCMCVWAIHSCAPLPLHVSGLWNSLQQQQQKQKQQLLTALACLFDAHHSSEACLTHPSIAYKHQLSLCSTNDSIIMLKMSRHVAHFLSFGLRHGERSVLIIVSTELTGGGGGNRAWGERECDQGIKWRIGPLFSVKPCENCLCLSCPCF